MSQFVAAKVSIDTVKAYWDARPCNIRHSRKPVGSKEYFDEVETRKYYVEPHIPGFAQFARWKGKRVLEVGCGIGTDTVNFARAGAQVTAVDLSTESLAVAKQRAEVFGFKDQVKFFQEFFAYTIRRSSDSAPMNLRICAAARAGCGVWWMTPKEYTRS